MKHFSLNFVVATDDDTAITTRLQRCIAAMEMVLNTNGLAAELIMTTPVDQDWVDRVHAELDEADED